MGWYVIVATIPIGIFGLAFRNQIEDRGPQPLPDRHHADRRWASSCCWPSAWGAGCATWRTWACATPSGSGSPRPSPWCPGVSRSGATITAALFLDMKREAAARFSFLLSIPAVVLSGLFGLVELARDNGGSSFGDARHRHGHRLHRRLRLDRLPAALPGPPLDAGLRGLPGRGGRAWSSPWPPRARSATRRSRGVRRAAPRSPRTRARGPPARAPGARRRTAGPGRTAARTSRHRCRASSSARSPDESMKPTAERSITRGSSPSGNGLGEDAGRR